ncbi:MAG: peptidylprolyl isomerase [Methylophilaceae bacterium]|nr:peptidylprolyl isomerase [Methylophilaceae bacterium]
MNIRQLIYCFIALLFAFNSIVSFAATKVEFKTTEGDFIVELYPEKAPITVANFLQYVKEDFYKKTIFHRVINDFMIQGGGFERDLYEKPTRGPIKNESNNGLKNKIGSIAMARTADPNSATAQFYINLNNNAFLDYTGPEPERVGYCVFGQVISGMDVVKKIGIIPTGQISRFSDVPTKAIKINSVKLLDKK